MPDTKPGDLVGQDQQGNVRIDRVIPLPWLVTIIVTAVINAVIMWSGLEQLVKQFEDLSREMRELRSSASALAVNSARVESELRGLERRLERVEEKQR